MNAADEGVVTPAARIARTLEALTVGNVPDAVLDALCPKGERVVLDRTGDTDRLIRQHPAVNAWLTNRRQLGLPPLWVDIEDGPDE